MNKNGTYLVRKFRLSDLAAVERIIQDLHPEWFTEEALENIPRDIQFARCFVIEKNGTVVGFISVHIQDGNPMIGCILSIRRMNRVSTNTELPRAISVN